jgi:hypothetical protein
MELLAALGRAAADLAFSALQWAGRGKTDEDGHNWLGSAICLLLAIASFYWTLDWLQSDMQLASRLSAL